MNDQFATLPPSSPAKSKSRAGFWALLVLSVFVTLAVAALLVFLLWPSLRAVVGQQTSGPGETFEIASEAQVSLPTDWVVQPGAHDSLRVSSPDRQLEVWLTVPDASQTPNWLDAFTPAPFVTLESTLAEQPDARVREEKLGNGAIVRYLDLEDSLVGELELRGTSVAFDAGLAPDRGPVPEAASGESALSLDRYRATIAELLLKIEPLSGA